VVFLTIVLYGYIYHLYKGEKKGKRNYEKYGKLALDDELTSPLVESNEENEQKEQ
jgi:cytochrome c oxidase cbb3-type subunit 4